jgi:hypothetical protein
MIVAIRSLQRYKSSIDKRSTIVRLCLAALLSLHPRHPVMTDPSLKWIENDPFSFSPWEDEPAGFVTIG